MRTDPRAIRTLLGAASKPSRFAQRCLETCNAPIDGIALDIPCGAGRHIETLRARGYAVVGADISAVLLDEARRRSEQSTAVAVKAAFIRVDATRPLPFVKDLFDVVLAVHYYVHGVVRELSMLVKPGGCFILETFGAQGGNYVQLPLQGEIRSELRGDWLILEEHEHSVRSAPNRCVVRFFGRRRASGMISEAEALSKISPASLSRSSPPP